MIRRENKQSQIFTRRALMLMGVQTAVLGVLGARLWSMQILEGERYATLAEGNRISTRLTVPPRGRLLDRGGGRCWRATRPTGAYCWWLSRPVM